MIDKKLMRAAYHPSYRKDIDGLRAVAILMVIFYHGFPDLFKGGFAGVDVFFVISGFLITDILQKNISDKSFSLADFYTRRVNRIFPSLLVMLISVLLLGWFVLLADEYKQISEYVISSATFFTNYLILGQISYFDNAADLKPLINLWSLAVEEQFYIVWPLLLILLNKFGLNLKVWAVALGVISFGLNLIFVKDYGSNVFFEPQFRAWEFLVGGILCFKNSENPSYHEKKSNSQSSVAAVISIVSILFLCASAFLINQEMPYPGWIGLLPVLGTAGLILVGPNGFINKTLLSNRILVWVGLISYPLYLFHWPILSLAHIIIGRHLSATLTLLLLGMAVVCAAVSYHLIESPLKRIKSIKKTWFLLFCMLITGSLALIFYSANGVEFRQAAQNGIKLTDAKKDWRYSSTKLESGKIVGIHSLNGDKNDKVLFIGSSLIGQYYPRVKFLFDQPIKPKLSVLYASRDHCNPYPGDIQKTFPENVSCTVYYNSAIDLAKSEHVVKIVMGGKWPNFFRNNTFTDDGKIFINDLKLLRALGKDVIILGNPPAYKYFSQLRATLGSQANLVASRSSMESIEIYRGLQAIANAADVKLINVYDYFCTENFCPIVEDGVPLYFDSTHITATFAEKSALFIDEIINSDHK